MTTEEQLRSTLGTHAVGAPAGIDRIGQVRGRIRVRRQRRAAGASLALAVVVAAVVVPLTAGGHGSTAKVQPIATPPEPVAGYAYGGHQIGTVTRRSSATDPGATFTFRPTSYRLVLATDCGGDLNAAVSVSVDGHALTEGSCGAQVGQVADAAAARVEWQRVVRLDQPNTVTVTRLADTTSTGDLTGGPAPAGTVSASVYQWVPFTTYPIPPRRIAIYPFSVGGGTKTDLDSRQAGPNGTFSYTAVIGPHAQLELQLVGPGLVDLSVAGQHLITQGAYDYGTQDDSFPLDRATLTRESGVHVTTGERVTVTVTTSGFGGPYWLIDAGMDG